MEVDLQISDMLAGPPPGGEIPKRNVTGIATLSDRAWPGMGGSGPFMLTVNCIKRGGTTRRQLKVSPDDIVQDVIDRLSPDFMADLRFHGEFANQPKDLSLLEIGMSQSMEVDLQISDMLAGHDRPAVLFTKAAVMPMPDDGVNRGRVVRPSGATQTERPRSAPLVTKRLPSHASGQQADDAVRDRPAVRFTKTEARPLPDEGVERGTVTRDRPAVQFQKVASRPLPDHGVDRGRVASILKSQPHKGPEVRGGESAARVRAFYEEHNSDKIADGTMARLLEHYQGNEDRLLRKLQEKYPEVGDARPAVRFTKTEARGALPDEGVEQGTVTRDRPSMPFQKVASRPLPDHGVDRGRVASILKSQPHKDPLPAGWSEHMSQTGVPYYYQAATHNVTWERPKARARSPAFEARNEVSDYEKLFQSRRGMSDYERMFQQATAANYGTHQADWAQHDSSGLFNTVGARHNRSDYSY